MPRPSRTVDGELQVAYVERRDALFGDVFVSLRFTSSDGMWAFRMRPEGWARLTTGGQALAQLTPPPRRRQTEGGVSESAE